MATTSSRKNLFQYAVLFHPKNQRDAMGNDVTPPTEIVTPITAAVAHNDQEVSIIAARGIPEKYLNALDEVEIIVRPFV